MRNLFNITLVRLLAVVAVFTVLFIVVMWSLHDEDYVAYRALFPTAYAGPQRLEVYKYGVPVGYVHMWTSWPDGHSVAWIRARRGSVSLLDSRFVLLDDRKGLCCIVVITDITASTIDTPDGAMFLGEIASEEELQLLKPHCTPPR